MNQVIFGESVLKVREFDISAVDLRDLVSSEDSGEKLKAIRAVVTGSRPASKGSPEDAEESHRNQG